MPQDGTPIAQAFSNNFLMTQGRNRACEKILSQKPTEYSSFSNYIFFLGRKSYKLSCHVPQAGLFCNTWGTNLEMSGTFLKKMLSCT